MINFNLYVFLRNLYVVYLLFFFFLQGAGLENLGNTCFINAILQCFTHTLPLVQALRSFDHPRPCDGKLLVLGLLYVKLVICYLVNVI